MTSSSCSAESSRVSVYALIAASGVFSSCETLATKSCRIRSRRRRSVTSWKTRTAPDGVSPGRAAPWIARTRGIDRAGFSRLGRVISPAERLASVERGVDRLLDLRAPDQLQDQAADGLRPQPEEPVGAAGWRTGTAASGRWRSPPRSSPQDDPELLDLAFQPGPLRRARPGWPASPATPGPSAPISRRRRVRNGRLRVDERAGSLQLMRRAIASAATPRPETIASPPGASRRPDDPGAADFIPLDFPRSPPSRDRRPSIRPGRDGVKRAEPSTGFVHNQELGPIGAEPWNLSDGGQFAHGTAVVLLRRLGGRQADAGW